MQNKMDFILSAYKQLIHSIQSQGYFFQTFEEYIQNSREKVVILRHDVDRLPSNALVIAKIEKEAGIKASYYFRIVKASYDEDVIKKIAEMGHEIGYHYENLFEISRKSEVGSQRSEVGRARARDRDPQNPQIDADYLISHRRTPVPSAGATGQAQTDADICPADFAGQKWSSLCEKKEFRDKFFELAICDFERNLEKLRKFYPVKTICMHGSPLSKWDNRDLWKRYDYRDFGIIAEPYFDVDFDEVFYITDAGRAWNNENVSIRDKVKSQFKYNINSTADIMNLIQSENAPDKIMLNVHTHRWFDFGLNWCWEFVSQNLKNVIKYIIVNKSK